jgi:hypothetical protein
MRAAYGNPELAGCKKRPFGVQSAHVHSIRSNTPQLCGSIQMLGDSSL